MSRLSHGGQTLELFLPSSKRVRFLPSHHVFTQGDYVRVLSESDEKQCFTSELLSTTPTVLRMQTPIAISAEIFTSGKHMWRVDHGFNETTYARMEKGLRDPGLCSGCYPTSILAFVVQSYQTKFSALNASEIQIKGKNPVLSSSRLVSITRGLNEKQRAVVHSCANSLISLVQGPPGTGKTQTSVAVLQVLASRYGHKTGAVLATAFNNVAVDELARRAMEAGLTVVRVGNAADPELQAISVRTLASKKGIAIQNNLDNAEKELRAVRKQMERAHLAIRKLCVKIKKRIQQEAQKNEDTQKEERPKGQKTLWKKGTKKNKKGNKAAKVDGTPPPKSIPSVDLLLFRSTKKALEVEYKGMQGAERRVFTLRNQLKDKIALLGTQIIRSADIVCCTCIGAAAFELHGLTFKAVLIDECSQALEPACIIPILKLSKDVAGETTTRLVLVGDHKQLPPTVTSNSRESCLTLSLFERVQQLSIHLSDNHPHLCTSMLTTQYRMHPALSYFPSKHFYEGRLLNGVNEEDRILPMTSSLKVLCDQTWNREPLFFCDTGESVVEQRTGTSFTNKSAADLVCKIASEMLKCGVIRSSSSAGVITAYAKQRQLLTNRKDLPEGIEVRTVDGFQGREKEVIIFDMVRSNNKGELGFLATDERRLNVALTRAQRLLVIVGNVSTIELSNSIVWKALLAHVQRNKPLAQRPQ
jgi:predicted DNA helicase